MTAVALAVASALAAYSPADIPNVHKANRTRYVSNPDGVLSRQAEERLDSLLGAVWQATSAEVVVVAVDSIEGADIDSFATELFSLWGIGKKDNDNGLLILISRGDRRATLRTGYGLEGVLPDAVCGRIIRGDMAPRFRERPMWPARSARATPTIPGVGPKKRTFQGLPTGSPPWPP